MGKLLKYLIRYFEMLLCVAILIISLTLKTPESELKIFCHSATGYFFIALVLDLLPGLSVDLASAFLWVGGTTFIFSGTFILIHNLPEDGDARTNCVITSVLLFVNAFILLIDLTFVGRQAAGAGGESSN